jgi:hypothetical protein
MVSAAAAAAGAKGGGKRNEIKFEPISSIEGKVGFAFVWLYTSSRISFLEMTP